MAEFIQFLAFLAMIGLVGLLYWIPSDMATKRGRNPWATFVGSLLINPVVMIIAIAILGDKKETD